MRTTKKMRKLALMLVLIFLLTACGRASTPTTPGVTRSTPTVTPTPTNTPTPTPTSTPTPTPTPTCTPTPTPFEKSAANCPINAAQYGFTVDEVLDYFCEVALESEYSDSPIGYIRKWDSPIFIAIKGTPNDEDRALMNKLLSYLNSVQGFPGIVIMESLANFTISFMDEKEYKAASSKVFGMALTDGYSTIWYRSGVINTAEVGILNTLTRTNKNHVILEEIVQSLGLQNDSYRYNDSLFYQAYNEPQWLSNMDQLLLAFLYNPQVEINMTEEEVRAIGHKIIYGIDDEQ